MAHYELRGLPGEIKMTVEIKRADSGAVEKYELVGTVVPPPTPQHHEVSGTIVGAAARLTNEE